MADLKQKELIFGVMEVVFAFATVFAMGEFGVAPTNWGTGFACVLGCSGALVPLLMRFCLRYFRGGGLSKLAEMMVMIWAMALYYTGGIVLIIIRQDNSWIMSDWHYLPAAFALVVAIISTIDFVLGLLNK